MKLLKLIGLCSIIISPSALAMSAQVKGNAALVGEYQSGMPPNRSNYQAWRIPLSLSLEARPSSQFSLFLDFQAGVGDYPTEDRLLGGSLNHPFILSSETFPQNDVPLRLKHAYFIYNSPVGLIKAGRIPRHWGLGLWRNAQWNPTGGLGTSTDSIVLTLDFTQTFNVTASFDKDSEGNPRSKLDDADGFSIEAVLSDLPTQANSVGFSRELGLAFSKFESNSTNTDIKIIDAYSRMYFGPLGIDGEILFPSGTTKNPAYSVLGGSGACPDATAGTPESFKTCEAQKIEGFAALFKIRYLMSERGNLEFPDNSLASYDAASDRLPTKNRGESHLLGLWLGFASGDKDVFETRPDNSISAIPMHPSIKAGLLMHGALPAQGLPSGFITNTTFLRGEYTYESPNFGRITPSVIWAKLNTTASNSSVSNLGRRASLGLEFDLKYEHTLEDNMNMGVEGGLWLPGDAWKLNNKPGNVIGLRTFLSMSF